MNTQNILRILWPLTIIASMIVGLLIGTSSKSCPYGNGGSAKVIGENSVAIGGSGGKPCDSNGCGVYAIPDSLNLTLIGGDAGAITKGKDGSLIFRIAPKTKVDYYPWSCRGVSSLTESCSYGKLIIKQ